MSRPLRIEYEDAYYHVMNRGRERQKIFHDPAHFESFLETLSEAHQRFGLQIHAYCLMGNHFHLLVTIKVSEDSVYQSQRGRVDNNVPRWVAMYLSQECGSLSLRDIAGVFGLKRTGSIPTTLRKLKQLMKSDSRMQKRWAA